nr:copia protein [Tanacetum cinerariifolium]
MLETCRISRLALYGGSGDGPFLLENGMCIQAHTNILLDQIYVNDIIFGATNKDLCKSFEKLMKDKFKMSSMGELTFFLGIQVKQKKDGIFISQDKYVAEILRKFRLTEGKSASTPIDIEKSLLKDTDGEDVDVHTYRLISWQCKKQTVVATSSIETEYEAAASCCTQVLWIQNQLLDYGGIFIDDKVSAVKSKFCAVIIKLDITSYSSDSPLLGVNTPRSDEDRLELMELTVFLLPKVEKVRTGVNVVDLQVSTVRHKLLVNDVTRLQALVHKKKVVVTEAIIREALHLDDEDGIDCLLNEEIFVELTRIGYEKPSTKLTFYKAFFSSQWKFLLHTILQCMSAKRTSWNEFSSSMASAVICLSSGKGFYEVETPLFESMLVEQQVDEEGDANENVEEVNAGDAVAGDVSAAHREVPTVVEEPSIPSPTPPTSLPQPTHDIPSTSQRVKKLEKRNKVRVLKLRRLKKVRTVQRVDTSDETVMDHANKVLSMQEDETEPAKVQKIVDVVTTAKLITKVVTAAPRRRKKGVVIRDPKELTTSTIIPPETKSKDKGKGILVEEPKPLKKKQQIEQDEQYARELHAELNKNIDDAVIDHVKIKAKEDPAVKKYQALKRKPQTEGQARKNMMLYLKNVAGFKMDYFKGMSYDDIRPIFEAKFNSNVAFLLRIKEQIEEDENRALQKLNETLAERAAKRQKLDEEVEELKRHLQIVSNEDDDVYIEATPLARKVLVVDNKIIELKNKPHYKIIRADDTHKLYVSFLSLLRNFDREHLEALWSLVKERFSTTKPKNFSDDFLLVTLGAMFEKPDIHAQI